MQDLLNIMHILRRECPWDRAQTPQSLTRYAIEEAYEVAAAVQEGDLDEIKKELGDLLLQVVFQAEMYSEQGAFDFDDIEAAICEKLIRRHPHVFNKNTAVLTTEQVSQQWQAIKQQEKQQKTSQSLGMQHAEGLLATIKPGPALMQAQHLQLQAAQVGFDFASVQDAKHKLDEELAELDQAILQNNVENIAEEFGDCLFALINIGRKLKVDSETALLSTIHKFRTRFAFIEQQASIQKIALEDMTLEQMEVLWVKAKQRQKMRDKNDQKQSIP